MKKRCTVLTVVLGWLVLAASGAAHAASWEVSYANVGGWAAWAAANTPGETAWAQDIYGGAASQLQAVSGTVLVVPTGNKTKFSARINGTPTLPAAITTAGGAYLGTLGPSYFVTFITRMHRSNGVLGSYKFNISTDRCQWIGCPGSWWPVGGLWIEDLFAKGNGSIKGTKTVKGTLNMNPAALPFMEIVGVLVYGVQEDNQEATLIAASPVPAP